MREGGGTDLVSPHLLGSNVPIFLMSVSMKSITSNIMKNHIRRDNRDIWFMKSTKNISHIPSHIVYHYFLGVFCHSPLS